MGWHATKNCENCEFRVQQFDIKGNEVNMCLIDNRCVGLIETCEHYSLKKGEHFSNI